MLTYLSSVFLLFFFIDPPPTAIYTLSLHDALPIWAADVVNNSASIRTAALGARERVTRNDEVARKLDRKSTRLNSSHLGISYAVFCLKKKKKKNHHMTSQQQIDERNVRIERTGTNV